MGGGPMLRENIRRIFNLEKNAALRTCFAAAISCGFYYLVVSMAHAQIGPKDGTNLPPTDLERVKVGDIAPDFTLEDMNGRQVTLSEVYRNRNVVLVFYRGQW